jgi:hypothetical protein
VGGALGWRREEERGEVWREDLVGNSRLKRLCKDLQRLESSDCPQTRFARLCESQIGKWACLR